MPGEDAFSVEGVIIKVLENGTCRVRLENGHELTGFLTGRARKSMGPLAVGDRVRMRLSPCDLSHGRIVPEETIKEKTI